MVFLSKLFGQRREKGRVEGFEKVTGAGKYAAEHQVEEQCYAVLVGSSVVSGKIKKLHIEQALEVDGVIDILSYERKKAVPGFENADDKQKARLGLPIFHSDTIHFKGQPIALVVAETLEDAQYAASLVNADYEESGHEVDFRRAYTKIALEPEGEERGQFAQWQGAPHILEQEYEIRGEVHHPMEMHATIAHWVSDDHLKLYDKTQGVNSVQQSLSALFNIPKEQIEVSSEFVGGGFGSGLRVWPHVVAAVMAAKQVGRPVKLMLSRPQMFTSVGYRPDSWQRIRIGADTEGRFLGIHHQARHGTSSYERFNEGITRITRMMYQFDHLKAESAVVPLNLNTPTWMRGPGDCTGDFAVECAIDELSTKLNMDPVEVRLKNLALDKHPDNQLPWSSNFLNECMLEGARRIGWDDRPEKAGSRSDGDWKIGYGMALGMWNAGRNKAEAAILMKQDGSLTVQTAMTDIGTGTGTAMLNITHQYTGVPKEKISIQLGDSKLPPAPSQGGSTGLSSLSGSVVAACYALKTRLSELAAQQNPAYKGKQRDDVLLSEKGISLAGADAHFISYPEIWQANQLGVLAVQEEAGPGEERKKYAFCSSAAHFCVLRVHSETGKVKIDKMISIADGGYIVNELAAANQISGASVGAIGMALMEERALDTRLGALIGDDLAGYHFPVNADAPLIEVGFINKKDPHINPVGAKGLGEVGIIGGAAAIANAIYSATGKRFRDLPITPDKILSAIS